MKNLITIKKDKNIKKIQIKYNIDNTCEITFPASYTDEKIQRSINPKLNSWLEEKMDYVFEDKILLFGEYYTYFQNLSLDSLFKIDQKNKELSSKYNPVNVFKDLSRLYNLISNDVLLEKINSIFNNLINNNLIDKKLNISFKLKYRKRALGMCEKKGHNNYVISLNPVIILAPIKSIESVIYHEIAHITEMNHSKNFYKILFNLMNEKEYKINQKWFNKLPAVTDFFK